MRDKSGQGANEPANYGFVVQTSDTAFLDQPTRFIILCNPGDIAVMLLGGDILVLTNLAMGVPIPLRIVKLFRTGTTCSYVLGFY